MCRSHNYSSSASQAATLLIYCFFLQFIVKVYGISKKRVVIYLSFRDILGFAVGHHTNDANHQQRHTDACDGQHPPLVELLGLCKQKNIQKCTCSHTHTHTHVSDTTKKDTHAHTPTHIMSVTPFPVPQTLFITCYFPLPSSPLNCLWHSSCSIMSHV